MRERIVRIVPALLALLYFALPSTQADVYVLTRSYILEPLPSLQADFGPPISAEGVDGVLRLADPLDACSPFTFTDTKQPWVALISREQRHKSIECTFDLKVRHAEQAGAQAAIVYDDLYESLIIMSKPLEHPDPGIPSVFVSEKAGLLLLRLLQLDEVHVRITPVSAVAWISMVMSAFLGLLAMTIVFSSFYVMRTWSYWLTHGHHPRQHQAGGAGATGRQAQQNQGLPPEVLRSFPVIIHENKPSPPSSPRPSGGGADDAERSSPHMEKGASCNSSDCEVPLPPGVHAGETKRMCTICLEHYDDGDKVRILPCYHRFHMQCIDAWLSGRSACPVCKHDASQPLQAVLDVQSAEGALQQLEGGGTAGTDVEQAAAPQRRWWSPLLRVGGVRRTLRWFRRHLAQQQHEEDPLLAAGGGRTSPANTDIEAGGGVRPAATPPPPPAAPDTIAGVLAAPASSQLPHQQEAGLELEQQQTRAHAANAQLLREQQAQALRQWEELQRQLPEATAEQQPLTAAAASPPSPLPPAPATPLLAGAQPAPAAAGPAVEQEERGGEVVSAAEELVRESVAATRAAAAASGLNEVLTPEAAAMMEDVAARQARAAAASSSLPPSQGQRQDV